MKPVFIKWVDAIGDPQNGWKDTANTEDFFNRMDNVVKELGFVYSEDEDYINLCSAYMPSDEEILTRQRTKIPKAWILERVDLNQLLDPESFNAKAH